MCHAIWHANVPLHPPHDLAQTHPRVRTCAKVSSPRAMILMASLLAPTVPSEPMPQNMHWYVPCGSVLISGPMGRDVNVTSSALGRMRVGSAEQGEQCARLVSRRHNFERRANLARPPGTTCTHARTQMRAPVMPMVKRSRGLSALRLSNTDLAMAGVKSLLPSP